MLRKLLRTIDFILIGIISIIWVQNWSVPTQNQKMLLVITLVCLYVIFFLLRKPKVKKDKFKYELRYNVASGHVETAKVYYSWNSETKTYKESKVEFLVPSISEKEKKKSHLSYKQELWYNEKTGKVEPSCAIFFDGEQISRSFDPEYIPEGMSKPEYTQEEWNNSLKKWNNLLKKFNLDISTEQEIEPEGMTVCQHCYAKLPISNIFCPDCGQTPSQQPNEYLTQKGKEFVWQQTKKDLDYAVKTTLGNPYILCPKCQTSVREDDVFCQQCGKRMRYPEIQAKIVAGITDPGWSGHSLW